MKKKPRIGRPPRKPGITYHLRGIPKGEWRRFMSSCRRNKMTARKRLLILISVANELISVANEETKASHL